MTVPVHGRILLTLAMHKVVGEGEGGGPDAAPHTREAHGYRWTWKNLIAVEVLSITLIPVTASPFSAVCSEIKHGFPFPTPSAKAGLHILY